MKRRVRHLASEANLDPLAALLRLQQAGLSLHSINDQVPVPSVERARSVLRSAGSGVIGNAERTVPVEVAPVAPPAESIRQPFSSPTMERPAKRIQTQKTAAVIRLTEDDVLAIRERMATTLIAEKSAFGASKPLWPDKFSMAVQRQFTSGGNIYKYNSIPSVGATLAFGLAMNHSFENGNKRTALVALLVFLNRNKTLLVDVAEDDLYELITGLVKHELPIRNDEVRSSDTEVASLARWIDERSRTLQLGDRIMEFSEMKSTLQALGCEFDSPSKNFIKIRRLRYSVKTGYPRQKFTLDAHEIKRIRRALQLDETHGFDSGGFYDLEGSVDEFVNRYRNVMRRLADT